MYTNDFSLFSTSQVINFLNCFCYNFTYYFYFYQVKLDLYLHFFRCILINIFETFLQYTNTNLLLFSIMIYLNPDLIFSQFDFLKPISGFLFWLLPILLSTSNLIISKEIQVFILAILLIINILFLSMRLKAQGITLF